MTSVLRRWRSVWIVARWEFTTTVVRPTFLFVLVGLPIAHLAMAALFGAALRLQPSSPKPPTPIAVVDTQGILARGASPDLVVADKDAALKELAAGRLGGVFVLDADYLRSGRVDVYERPALHLLEIGKSNDKRERAAAVIRRGLAGGSGHDERLVNPLVETTDYRVEGETIAVRVAPAIVDVFAGPFGVCFIMALSIFLASGGLQQSMSTELQNRMLEVILSVVTPLELLTGKVIGLAAAGLVQAAVYLVNTVGVAPLVGGVTITWDVVLWSGAIFLAGYILFAVLMAGTGALVTDSQEVPQLASLWMLLSACPFFLIIHILGNPSSVLARVLTWIPPTAPVALLLRISADGVGSVERAGAVSAVLVFSVLSLFVAARLFGARVQSGGRLSLRGVLWS